jgi:hypothetical protein
MKHNPESQPVSYAPAVTAAGAAIALYLLSKIGELVVILLLWGAYAALAFAALHVVSAWLGVPLLTSVSIWGNAARQWLRRNKADMNAGKDLSRVRRAR